MRNKIKKAFLIVLPAFYTENSAFLIVLPTFYTENSAFLISFQIISHSILTIYAINSQARS